MGGRGVFGNPPKAGIWITLRLSGSDFSIVVGVASRLVGQTGSRNRNTVLAHQFGARKKRAVADLERPPLCTLGLS